MLEHFSHSHIQQFANNHKDDQMKTLTAIATAGVLTISAMSAQASVVFDLTGKNVNSQDMSFNEGSIGLTASSGTVRHGNISTGGKLTQTSDGLGVYSHRRDSDGLDSTWNNEAIVFVFDQIVSLTDVNLSLFDKYGKWGDDWSFFFDTDSDGDLDRVFRYEKSNPYSFDTPYVGTTFAIAAEGAKDNFRIHDLTVAASAVPEPSSLLLLGAGLVVAAAGRRKRA